MANKLAFKRINAEHSQFLNVLRACSAYVVLISHIYKAYILRTLPPLHPLYIMMDTLAAYAVMTFFILSGFLITYSILNIVQRNNGYFNVNEYIKLRLLRLHPPLTFALILTLFIAMIINQFNLFGANSYLLPGDINPLIEKASYNLKDYLYSFFYLQDVFIGEEPQLNLPLWSLSYEFWYYMFAMFCTIAFVNKKWWLGISAFIICIASILYLNHSRVIILFLVWLAGVLLAYLYLTDLLFSRRGRIFQIISLIACATIAILILQHKGWAYLYPYTNYLIDPTSNWILTLLSIALMFSLSLMLSFNYFPKGKMAAYLAPGARYSYTLYVIHFPLLLLSFSLLGPYINYINIPLLTCTIVPILFFGLIIIAKYLAKFLENREWLTSHT